MDTLKKAVELLKEAVHELEEHDSEHDYITRRGLKEEINTFLEKERIEERDRILSVGGIK
jgi:hypothetical protein